MDPFTILMGLQTAASLLNRPDNPTNQVAAQAGGMQQPTQSVFEQNTPGAKAPEAAPKLDMSLIDSLAKMTAAKVQAPPPTVPLMPPAPQGKDFMGPPEAPPTPAPQQPQGMSVGEMLMASPQALQSVAGLLGMGQDDRIHQQAAPIPGGSVGNVVQGFNLPSQMNIGDILARIPGIR